MSFLLTLILQIAVVLAAARAVGWLFRRIRQPQVVGEMVAGIMLGPSLLGWLAPGASALLFPAASMGYLNTLSQVGLLVFMFLVGLEFDPRLLRGRGHTALVTSHVSIVAPFFLGAALALYLYPRLSDDSVSFTGFALFMGAAMSVTAFPVLARILTERNLLGTRVGAIAIACAAVDDVTAWTILALVVAIVRSSAVETPLWLTLTGTAIYMAAMLVVVRRALRMLESFYHSRGRLTQDMVAITLLLLLASAWITEWLGIHALFGAFALGAVMPKEPGLVHGLREKLEDLTVVFLLPLFFAFTGLRTSIGLVGDAEMWTHTALIMLVAVTGKFGGSALAARATGLDWREAGAVGILMNTRGLMELVILNIGLELGVISPAVFTMMVMMALVTTFMTTPLLELIYPARRIREESAGDVEPDRFTVLLPIALPRAGPGLLDAARVIAPPDATPRIYALHLDYTPEQSLTRVEPERLPAQVDGLQPVLAHARAHDVELRPLAFASSDLAQDILDVAAVKRASLILLGWHKPVIGRSVLSGTVATVLQKAQADVAVLVDRTDAPWRRILVPYIDPALDAAPLELAGRIAYNTGAALTVLHVVRAANDGQRTPPAIDALPAGARVLIVTDRAPVDAALAEARAGYDLIVARVSKDWGTLPTPFGLGHEALAAATSASLLVVQTKDAVRTR
jgi:Kef-type K+ transport system membrane component KefB